MQLPFEHLFDFIGLPAASPAFAAAWIWFIWEFARVHSSSLFAAAKICKKLQLDAAPIKFAAATLSNICSISRYVTPDRTNVCNKCSIGSMMGNFLVNRRSFRTNVRREDRPDNGRVVEQTFEFSIKKRRDYFPFFFFFSSAFAFLIALFFNLSWYSSAYS